MPNLDVARIRQDFPILRRQVNGRELVYLDSAATTQKPQQVLDTLQRYYAHYNANVHRSSHTLALEASELYEQAHQNVAEFIGAKDWREVVFVRNTTEAINLVAHALLNGSHPTTTIGAGDEIVTTVMEHHANLVPWQFLRDRTGAVLKVVPMLPDGTLDMDEFRRAVTPRTKLVACAHASNVLGTIHPVQEIGRLAHEVGALFLVDGAQSAPHMAVDVNDIGCDFYAFSGHKMLAPMGIGVLWARRDLLQNMTPFLFGGEMIREVTVERATWNDLPWKFEAGTANVAGAIALAGAEDLRTGEVLEGAITYLQRLGMDQVREHEKELTGHALAGLAVIPNVQVYGPLDVEIRGGAATFSIVGGDIHLTAQLLNDEGIAIRSGGHCAHPLADCLQVEGTLRASFYVYNTVEEVDRFLQVLADVVGRRLL